MVKRLSRVYQTKIKKSELLIFIIYETQKIYIFHNAQGTILLAKMHHIDYILLQRALSSDKVHFELT